MSKGRSSCNSRHELAIARWEDNREQWLKGDLFGITSNKPDLQQMIGEGGTHWIVVSRRSTQDNRLYSLSFRLDNCRKKMFSEESKFGRYGVVGDPENSTLFVVNDSMLLLLSLRFDPYRPIKRPNVVGQSIQTPRCLNENDIGLLENYIFTVDRWSVFLSYKHSDIKIAKRIAENLRKSGINIFRNQEALKGGQKWWPVVTGAIERSRKFILLIGESTHNSVHVHKELKHALKNNIQIIPVLIGGDWNRWTKLYPELTSDHYLNKTGSDWSDFITDIEKSIRSKINLDIR